MMTSSITVATRVAPVNGADLAYDISGTGGDGPPVVFVHAGVCDRRMWEYEYAVLASRHTVVRYDARGYGESPMSGGLADPAFSRHGDLLGLIDHLGIERAILVGCSMGGGTVLDAALTAPEHVAGLVVVSTRPNGSPRDPEIVAGWRAVDAAYDADGVDAAVEIELQMWVDGPFRDATAIDPAIRSFVGEMDRIALMSPEDGPDEIDLDPPAYDRLAEITAPVVVIAGSVDYPSVVHESRRMAELLPNARLELIAGAAHLPNLERPQRFMELLREALIAQQ